MVGSGLVGRVGVQLDPHTVQAISRGPQVVVVTDGLAIYPPPHAAFFVPPPSFRLKNKSPPVPLAWRYDEVPAVDIPTQEHFAAPQVAGPGIGQPTVIA